MKQLNKIYSSVRYGYQILCWKKSTAERVGYAGRDPIDTFEHEGNEYININNLYIIQPDMMDYQKELKNSALEKLKTLGLTEGEIKALCSDY